MINLTMKDGQLEVINHVAKLSGPLALFKRALRSGHLEKNEALDVSKCPIKGHEMDKQQIKGIVPTLTIHFMASG